MRAANADSAHTHMKQTRRTYATSHNSRPTIGVTIRFVPEWDVWLGALQAARAHDINLIGFAGERLRAPGFLSQANALYDLISAEQLDALLVWSSLLGTSVDVDEDELQAIFARFQPLPLVSMGVPLPGIPSVSVGNYQGMRNAVEHLIEAHGHRRIAFIRGSTGNPEGQERYQAYCDALAHHGIPLDEDLVVFGDWYQASGETAMGVLLDERGIRPDAVVTTDDEMAYGALDALQSRGIQVPDGVPVVGFDDQAESRFTAPPLTTVRQVRRKVGWCAVEMALKMLSGQPVSEHVVVPTELIVRQSCGCQPPEVVRAAIGECNRSFGEGVRTVLSTRREEILAELEQANGQVLAREPLAHALNAFIDEISGQATGGFLPALDRSLQQVLAQGEDAMVWQGVISSLRQQAIPCLTDNAARARAEDLCQQAHVLVGEATQREGGRKELRMVQRAETLLQLSRSLAAALTIEELSDHLSQGLPLLGIKRCYLALYEDPQRPAEWSRLVLARDEQGRLPLEQGGRRFASPQLLPTDIWPAEGTCQLIVAPLYLRERQLGFALFDAVHPDGSVYEALRGQISSALEVVLLSMRNAALYRGSAAGPGCGRRGRSPQEPVSRRGEP